jgi:hypothetical protein
VNRKSHWLSIKKCHWQSDDPVIIVLDNKETTAVIHTCKPLLLKLFLSSTHPWLLPCDTCHHVLTQQDGSQQMQPSHPSILNFPVSRTMHK